MENNMMRKTKLKKVRYCTYPDFIYDENVKYF